MKIQKAKDPDNLTGFEQKHLPWILMPDFIKKKEEFKITVKVGKVDHPMTNEHYIRGIQLCINGKCFERKVLNLSDHSEAEFKVILEKDSTITARAECNLHGAWEARKRVVLCRAKSK